MNHLTTKPDDYISPYIEKIGSIEISQGGLTKREYFALAVLQGLISNATLSAKNKQYTKTAISLSDALIEELNKTKT